ncbi:MAG: RNA-binding cell elongation regulator Jag/EloR, partial [Christensenellales bacterium]
PAPAKPQTPAQAKPAPVQPKPQQPKPQAQPKADKPQAAKPAQPKPQPPKPPRAPHPAQPRPEIARPAIPDGPLPDQDPTTLSELGRRAYEYLDKLTKLMGVPVKIYVAEAEGSMSISMMGDTLGILIGRRGDTLDALQYLTSLEVNRDRDEYVRVSLDTEHYRAKREESLTRLAARMADRAVKTGRKVVLEPMNPYERRVLHATLQDHPYVQTHSEGDEPNRRVVITLKSEAPQPDGDTARPAKRAPRPERRDQKPGERQSRPPRADKPRPPRPVRPEKDAVKPVVPVDVPMAHDVPEDPTDDTI